MNRYLSIAAQVLHEVKQPLSARDILRVAYSLQIVPEDLYGKTQHKTMHARLAEDIVRRRLKSEFVRTDPGRFFLRVFAGDKSIPERHKRQYFASLRADQLRRFHVACLDKVPLLDIQQRYGCVVSPEKLSHLPVRYRSLTVADRDPNIVHLRVLVLIRKDHELLIRRRRSSEKNSTHSGTSIGLLGFVKQGDKTLFSTDGFGLRESALRTLSEQLHLVLVPDSPIHNDAEIPELFIVDLNSAAIGKAIAGVVAYAVPPESRLLQESTANEEFDWYDMTSRINDIEHFDPWSKHIVSTLSLNTNRRST